MFQIVCAYYWTHSQACALNSFCARAKKLVLRLIFYHKTTTQKPDLVIVNRALQSVIIFELTVPWDGNVITAHNHKTNKYASLLVDLSNSGYTADLYCFEVSVRGQITKDNFARLRSYLYKTVGHSKLSCRLSKNISKAAILGSFSIFAARNEPIWSVGNDLSVQL